MSCWEFFRSYNFWKRIQRIENTDSNTTCTVVGKNGKVYGTYSNVTAYGYGYTVVETSVADFNDAYYKYDMYNPNGEIVYTYKSVSSEKASVGYSGEGVFCIHDNDEKQCILQKQEKNGNAMTLT